MPLEKLSDADIRDMAIDLEYTDPFRDVAIVLQRAGVTEERFRQVMVGCRIRDETRTRLSNKLRDVWIEVRKREQRSG